MKCLVSEEEISNVAKLMKIDLEDHSSHIKRVQKMLEYFDILDKANVESEEIIVQDAPWVPLWFTGERYALVKPYVKGYKFLPMIISKLKEVSIES